MPELTKIEKILLSIWVNDKTEYDYGNNKIAKNRNGKLPGVGKRFLTPREIVEDYFGSDFWTKKREFDAQ